MISCVRDAEFLEIARNETPYYAVEYKNSRIKNVILQLCQEYPPTMKEKLPL